MDELDTEVWAESVAPQYETILEAEEVEDDQALADILTAGLFLAAWLYDRKKARYLRPETRSPLTSPEIELLIRDRVWVSKQNMDTISDRYQLDGNIRNWEKAAKAEIEDLHSQLYVLGMGGLAQTSQDAADNLRRLLAEQYRYLDDFKRAIANDELSPLRIASRLRNYAQSATMSYFKGRDIAMKVAGYKRARWVLGESEHCKGCLRLAALGVVNIGVLPAIGSQECMFNCHCRKEFFR